jgi:hypothetical protein
MIKAAHISCTLIVRLFLGQAGVLFTNVTLIEA